MIIALMAREICEIAERQQWQAGSTDRRNTLGELFSWRLILQCLSGPFI